MVYSEVCPRCGRLLPDYTRAGQGAPPIHRPGKNAPETSGIPTRQLKRLRCDGEMITVAAISGDVIDKT